MKKILLCCSAGMSTSMLVKKMEQAAAEQGIECVIEAHGVTVFNELIQDFDVCLLGPQVRFQQSELQKIADDYNKQVAPIPPQMYGMMKGDEVLAIALSLIPETA
ncbi:PTS sugar transporter subunit IIB [Photobacterium jeanii]|uniref:PTS sugar transporter subunit IIB n=1 Tax=Photobacterium jeanii TaxID=858640 RepID=A0A178KNT3_9GAMM|nr:PTS sugar transporter subunit IIB [Photobacterium jeanii]OAN19068.1 PTS sugar transporter subunit IIB [Photobacterium jeanii]PST87734.1 PTS sugar transporter subunit IIB [Photobacterium jeanii]